MKANQSLSVQGKPRLPPDVKYDGSSALHLWDYRCLTDHPGAYDIPGAGAEPGLCRAHAEPEPLTQALLLHASREREDTDGTEAWDHSVCAQGSPSPRAALGLL